MWGAVQVRPGDRGRDHPELHRSGHREERRVPGGKQPHHLLPRALTYIRTSTLSRPPSHLTRALLTVAPPPSFSCCLLVRFEQGQYTISLPAVIIVFFTSGLSLPTRVLLDTLKLARVHALTQALSLWCVPVLGYGLAVALDR